MNFFYLNSVILLVLSMLYIGVLGDNKCSNEPCKPDRQSICGFNNNTRCYRDFVNECERRRYNCGRKPNERFYIARIGRCDDCNCLRPICCKDCTGVPTQPICGVSIRTGCYQDFKNECSLQRWNCKNPRNPFRQTRTCPCDARDTPRCRRN